MRDDRGNLQGTPANHFFLVADRGEIPYCFPIGRLAACAR